MLCSQFLCCFLGVVARRRSVHAKECKQSVLVTFYLFRMHPSTPLGKEKSSRRYELIGVSMDTPRLKFLLSGINHQDHLPLTGRGLGGQLPTAKLSPCIGSNCESKSQTRGPHIASHITLRRRWCQVTHPLPSEHSRKRSTGGG